MFNEYMPLYPSASPCRDRDACVRVPLFGQDRCARPQSPPVGDWQKVMIENPCCPGQWAEVLLSVDACGNLAVCVRRAPDRDPCDRPHRRRREPCRLPEPRCDDRHGRLYGSWQ